MKRLIPIALLVALLVSGCGTTQPQTTAPAVTTAPTQATTLPTDAPTEAPTEDTTAPTEPEVLYRHPLTGMPLEEPFTGGSVAVSIGNTIAALPQHGIANADVFFEIEAEGDITRFLAIFTDLENTTSIGPIRSARTFFNNVSTAYGAPLAHCGGSVRGIRGYYDLTGSKISDWRHMDEFTYGTKYYFRDYDRYNYQGYAWEHCLFTSGEKMLQALEDLNYLPTEPWDLGYRFSDTPSLGQEAATAITVSFRGGKTTDFTYDEATGLYSAWQYDRDLIDGTYGDVLTFRNVMMLYADQSKKHDGSYLRSYYDLIGEGEGYFAADGKIQKILWSRADVKEPFVYTLEDGTPITMGVGKTYVGIADPDSDPIAYQ